MGGAKPAAGGEVADGRFAGGAAVASVVAPM